MPLNEKYKSEIDWWEEMLKPGNRAEWIEDAINPERRSKCSPDLVNLIAELGLDHRPRVLDVGSGPLSPMGWAVDCKLCDVIAVDPLAEIYGGILQKYGVEYPVKPIKGCGETISKMFEREYFDAVYTRNAIDHSDSPSECVENMVIALKTGGILYMEGFKNEGTRSNWEGLHKWNLWYDNGDLICKDKSGVVNNITENLPLCCFYSSGYANDWYRIAFIKSNYCQKVFFDSSERSRDTLVLVSGFELPEKTHMWTTQQQAELSFAKIPNISSEKNYALYLRAIPFAPEQLGPEQYVDVFVNNQKIARWTLPVDQFDSVVFKATVPGGILNESTDNIAISFSFSERKSPQNLGISADPRLLGMALSSIQISDMPL